MATIDRVDDGASPRQVIDAVIIRLATLFENDREVHRVRTTVIESEPALLERVNSSSRSSGLEPSQRC